LAVPIANDEARLKASRPRVMFLVMSFVFMFFPLWFLTANSLSAIEAVPRGSGELLVL